jgi:hypothetical protein
MKEEIKVDLNPIEDPFVIREAARRTYLGRECAY